MPCVHAMTCCPNSNDILTHTVTGQALTAPEVTPQDKHGATMSPQGKDWGAAASWVQSFH